MELDGNYINGHWAEDSNGEPQFFIINEAIISKLCILGEDVEPCFEGANITNVQFSFDESFMLEWKSIVDKVNELFIKGGTSVEDKNQNPALENALENPEEEIKEEEKLEDEVKDEELENPEEEIKDEENAEDAPADEEQPAEEEAEKAEEEAAEEPEGEDDAAAAYVLEEIPEYVALKEANEALQAEVAELREFRNQVDREKKQSMIDSFYMLSDEDKKDVIENIDNYSLNDIEAKLSIMCVRNKVSFNLDDNNGKETAPVSFNLDSNPDNELIPDWIKAVQNVAKNKM